MPKNAATLFNCKVLGNITHDIIINNIPSTNNKRINVTFEYDIVVGKKLKIFREGFAEELTVIITEKVSDYSSRLIRN